MKFVHLELVLLIGVTLAIAMPNNDTCSSKSGGPQDNPIGNLQHYVYMAMVHTPGLIPWSTGVVYTMERTMEDQLKRLL